MRGIRLLWVAGGVFIALQAGAVEAGSITVESKRGQQDALTRARQKMPADAIERRFECRDIVQPMVKKFHRCTIYWDSPPTESP